MKRIFAISLVVLSLAIAGLAQVPNPDPAPGTSTSFTMNLTPVTLPGNKTTLTGVSSGIAFTVTPNFDVKELNLNSSGDSYYGFGANYRLPIISTALNNVSPNINFLAFQFYLNGTVGANYGPGATQSHWSETVGGGVDYYINNTWSFGGEADYAHLVGYNNKALILFIGPKLHF